LKKNISGSNPLHSDQRFLAQHGRALFQRPDGKINSARLLWQCLIATIEHYVSQHNANPKPFVWAAKASDILEKVKRARSVFYKL